MRPQIQILGKNEHPKKNGAFPSLLSAEAVCYVQHPAHVKSCFCVRFGDNAKGLAPVWCHMLMGIGQALPFME